MEKINNIIEGNKNNYHNLLEYSTNKSKPGSSTMKKCGEN